MYTMMLDSHIPMFHGSLSNLSNDKMDLMYWCKFYYQVVFSQSEKDRPDDFTVDYDILLDEWIKSQNFKGTVITPNHRGTSASNMQNVINFG